MPLLPRAAPAPRRPTAGALAVADRGAPPSPERGLGLALAASLACHALVAAGLQWAGEWWPAGEPGAVPGRPDAVPMIVDLAAAGADDRVTLRVRPANAAGVTGGTGTALGPDVAAGTGRKAAATPPAPGPAFGVVIVAASDDIGLVDSALARGIDAEFGAPPTERPRLESELAVAYPEAALPDRRQMQIGVLVAVDENGDVVSTRKSIDDALFAPRIDAALRSAKFAPAMRDGRPVRHWTVLEFHFEVQGPPKFP